eukprot:TRINITY_DN4432_c0_g1_i1.p1 TRINITY_DN4432_c0_g1~~TRINITY_DN4432_c0_g1_i1.p1  ORF type:complete len:180 (+),score=28.76 TRINITY_DN4432_c0_g1_i1:110-649(+)
MIGLSEFVLLTGLGVSLVGLKGLPGLARKAGYGLGTLSSVLRQGSSAISNIARQHNVQEMHREMQAGLQEVQQIRAEFDSLTRLRTYTSAMNSFPDTSETPPATASPTPPARNLHEEQLEVHTEAPTTLPKTSYSAAGTSNGQQATAPQQQQQAIAGAIVARSKLRRAIAKAQQQQQSQ